VGGEVVAVEVSALNKTNIDELLTVINLQAELLDLKAVKEGSASGVVVESRVDVGRGVVATLLISSGSLKVGDIVVAGAHYGRVKALLDDKGNSRMVLWKLFLLHSVIYRMMKLPHRLFYQEWEL
jgi:translation initiation factor IF-2